jgi:hypothetical protein
VIALGVLGVWALVAVAEEWLVLPRWAWDGLMIGLGIGVQLLIEPSDWWWGVGIGGAAMLLQRLTDLLLVFTDWSKLHVLRRTR